MLSHQNLHLNHNINFPFRNLAVGEKNLPENNVVHRLWIPIWFLHYGKLDSVRAPHAAHRHVQLSVGEDGAAIPHSNVLQSLS